MGVFDVAVGVDREPDAALGAVVSVGCAPAAPAQFQVDAFHVVLIGREVDDGEQGANQQAKAFNALNALADDVHDFHETAGRLAVALAAEVAHDRPGRRGVIAGLVAVMVWMPVTWAGMASSIAASPDQEEAGGDRKQPQLVPVGHHRGDARQAEVERGNGVAELAQKRQREAAEGGIHVQVQALRWARSANSSTGSSWP